MSRRINFGDRDWTAHAQDHWLDFAGNPNFPDHLRIVFVAYGRHRANGHAKLDQGELARFLVRRDGTLPDRRTLWHALNKAIGHEFLLPDSRALCLVVSSDHAQGGRGNPDEKCQRNHTRRQKDASNERPSTQKDVNRAGPFEQKDVSGERPFTLVPSLSSKTVTTDQQEPA